jgi:hypothetical protein
MIPTQEEINIFLTNFGSDPNDPLIRFEFVNGYLTGDVPVGGAVECGDFTEYPLEITGLTIEQKFNIFKEIFYLAKKAQFTENLLVNGEIEGSPLSGPFITGVELGNINQRVNQIGVDFHMTGYWAIDDVDLFYNDGVTPVICDPLSLSYLSDNYSVLTSNDLSSTHSMDGTTKFRDISGSHSGLWWSGENTQEPIWNTIEDININDNPYINLNFPISEQNFEYYKTAFSWFSRFSAAGTGGAPELPIPFYSQLIETGDPPEPDIIYESFEVAVEYNGKVAYTGSHPFDPSGRLFIGMRGRMRAFPEFDSLLWFDTLGDPDDASISNYIVRTTHGDIFARLRAGRPDISSGDIVHETVELWSYDDTTTTTPPTTTTTTPPPEDDCACLEIGENTPSPLIPLRPFTTITTPPFQVTTTTPIPELPLTFDITTTTTPQPTTTTITTTTTTTTTMTTGVECLENCNKLGW